MRARDRLVVIIGGSSAHAGQFLAIDRRDFVNLRAASAPFAVKDASVFVSQTEFLETDCMLKCSASFQLAKLSNRKLDARAYHYLPLALLPQNFHRFVYHFFRDVERGTKTNGAFAGFQNQQTGIKQLSQNIIARLRRRADRRR